MNPILLAFAVVFGVVLILGVRHRLLGRIAIREGIRRPIQTMLVVGGLMVGAAGITAALVATDSAQESALLNVYRAWDRTDVLVTAGNSVFEPSVADRIAEATRNSGNIDGVMGSIEAIGSLSNRTQKSSDSGVRLIGFDPQDQRAFGAFTLADGTRTYGDDLGKDQVLVSRAAAASVHIQVGDTLVMAMERVEPLTRSPGDLGRRIRETARKLQAQKRELEKEASTAAEQAAEAAAGAYLAQVEASFAAQARAAKAEYLQQLRDYKKELKDLASQIPDPPPTPPPTPVPTPPTPELPEPPSPPNIIAPNPTQIQAQAAALAASAGEEAAARVADRYAPRLKRLGQRIEHLKRELDRTVENLKPIKLEVVGIAKAQGPGAYGLYSAVFATLPLAQRIAGTDKINVIRVSGTGDERTGLAAAERAAPQIEGILVDASTEDLTLELKQVKSEGLQDAKDNTAFTLAMLMGMTFLVIAAGVALIINLTQMLAEERRPRLATLRALGLTRRGLVTLSVLEGAIYSLLAAAVGTAVGLFAGKLLAERFAEAFAQFFGAEVDFVFVFHAETMTLIISFALGALITMGTLYFAAWKTSRLNIPAAIRNLPEPVVNLRRRNWPRLLGRLALLLIGVPALLGPDPAGQLFGGVLVAVAAFGALKQRIPERLRLTLLGATLSGWAFWVVFDAPRNQDNPNQFFGMFVMAVLISVIGLATLSAANLRVVEGISSILGPLTRRMRATLRVPLAYLARRQMRTGLTIIMFGVVVAVIAMFSVLLFVFQPQYGRDSLGWDIVVSKAGKEPLTLPEDVMARVTRTQDIRSEVYTGSLKSEFLNLERTFAPFYALTPEQLGDPPVKLSDREESYASDAEVWNDIRSDPRIVVSDLGRVGDDITLEGTNGPVTFHVAANPATGLFTGLVGTDESFAAFDDTARGQVVLLDVAPGEDAQAVADDIAELKYKKGVTSQSTRELLDKGYTALRTFFSIIDVLMRMGLIVGVLSLGILALRAIIERRHLIGVMRAIGYHKRSVLFGLLLEAAAGATLGLVVGAASGIAMGYIFYAKFFASGVFGVDWGSLWNSAVLIYVAVFLVTLGPAWRASRLPPAEAVRYVE